MNTQERLVRLESQLMELLAERAQQDVAFKNSIRTAAFSFCLSDSIRNDAVQNTCQRAIEIADIYFETLEKVHPPLDGVTL